MSAFMGDVRKIQTDPDTLESFYRCYIAEVRAFVARRVSDPFLAADLTADVFLAAMSASKNYDSRQGNPGAWLTGIARNVLLKDARKRAREARAMSRVASGRLASDDAITRAEEIIDSNREAREVLAGIPKLPRAERAIFELVVVDGLSADEAAEALGVQPGTARVRLHRARKRLTAASNLRRSALAKETP